MRKENLFNKKQWENWISTLKKITGSLYQHNAQKLICNGTRGGYDKKNRSIKRQILENIIHVQNIKKQNKWTNEANL